MNWLSFVLNCVEALAPILLSDLFTYTATFAVLISIVCILVRFIYGSVRSS